MKLLHRRHTRAQCTDDHITQLWRAADEAAAALQAAIAAAPAGAQLAALPEYVVWRAAARAYTDEAWRLADMRLGAPR